MVQRRESLGFARKSGEPVGIVRENVREDLERNFAIESRVTGAKDLPHPAFAERADDFVHAEAAAGCESQMDVASIGYCRGQRARMLASSGELESQTDLDAALGLARMASERRSVADEPDVPEGIDEPALAVRSPGRGVHLYPVTASRCPGRECARYECVRIITEDFNAYR